MNTKRQFLFQSFSISPRDSARILGAVGRWLRLELTEGWRTWFGEPQAVEPMAAARPVECAVR
jgi:hypothetical protein